MGKPNDSSKTSTSKPGGSKKSNGSLGARLGRSEADCDNEGESELLALQRTCLSLEAARKAEEREAQEVIRRQKQLLGSLNAEREGLQCSLAGLLPNRTDQQVTQALRASHIHAEHIDNLMAQEIHKLAGLEKQIRHIQGKMDEERKGSASKEDPAGRIVKLTTQLAKAESRFSSLISANSQLRQDIETLRGEKARFLQVHNKLQRELVTTRREKARVLDEAIDDMGVREEAHAKTLRARNQLVKDEESHEGEVRELRRELCHAENLEQFLQDKTKVREHDRAFLKAQEKRAFKERESQVEQQVQLHQFEEAVERIRDIVERRTKRKLTGSQLRAGATAGATPSEEPRDGGKRRPTLWDTVSRRRSTLVGPMFRAAAAPGGGADAGRRGRGPTEHRRRSTLGPGLLVEEQERLRELARTAAEEEEEDGGQEERLAGFDAQLLYTVYIEGEDRTFALFNYVSEQSRMMEEMTADLEQLRESIEQQEEAERADGSLRSRQARELELSRQQVAEASGDLQAHVEKSERTLALVKAGVQGLAAGAGVNSLGPVMEGDWTHNAVSRAMGDLLAQTEMRVIDLLAAHSFQTARNEDRAAGKMSSTGPDPGIRAPPTVVLNVKDQLPSTSFVDSEEEEGEEKLRPLSRDELKQRADRKISGTKDRQ